jgi:hypothetical protein
MLRSPKEVNCWHILGNVGERAVLLSPGPEIQLADLPTAISSQAAAAGRSEAALARKLGEMGTGY